MVAAVGLIHAGLLLASVQAFNFGMGARVQLHATAPQQALSAWRVIEPVAKGLGGSGGQIIGGVWIDRVAELGIHGLDAPGGQPDLRVIVQAASHRR